jgi:hypothetical protein
MNYYLTKFDFEYLEAYELVHLIENNHTITVLEYSFYSSNHLSKGKDLAESKWSFIRSGFFKKIK